MPKYTVSGSKVKTFVELTIDELALEAQYIIDRSAIEVGKLVSQGVSEKVALATITSQFSSKTEFVKSWMNKNKRIVDELHSQLVATPCRLLAKKNPKQKFAWVLDAGARHCADCESMSGADAKTIDEWMSEGVGLPRDGFTLCNVGCKCMLEAVD